MLRSLRDVVLPLDDETVVLPGHGPATTIGRERATNPYLAEAAAGAGPAPTGRGTVSEPARAPKGTFDTLPPDSARFLAVRDTLTAPLRRAGLRLRRDAGVRGHRRLLPRGGGVHRRRHQGDVHLRGPRRPLADAAPRAHRRADARLHRAPAARRRAAGEALDRRLGVPLRAPAGRPLPALHPGRHGGARRRRPGAGRRGGRAGRAGLPRPRADRLRAAADLAGRHAPAGRSTASCWWSSSRSSTSTRTPGAGRRSTRCGCSTTSGPRCRRSSTTPR